MAREGGCRKAALLLAVAMGAVALLPIASLADEDPPHATLIPCPGIRASSPATMSTTLPPGVTAPCPGVVVGTYIGGGGKDEIWDVAVDPDGNTWIVGITTSADLPTTPDAFDPSYNGESDVFVAEFDAWGRLIYSTYLGGAWEDRGRSLAIDPEGHVYVTGFSKSFNFPVTPGVVDTQMESMGDAFVAKFGPDGGLVYSTFLGGGRQDWGLAVAVDSDGSAYVGGYTESGDFPTTAGAFDPTYGGGLDAFVAKMSPDGHSLGYATFLGGLGDDMVHGIAADASGRAFPVGDTTSDDFPTTAGALGPTFAGTFDGFFATLSPDGTALVYSTYVGGSDYDEAWSVDLDGAGNAYVAGLTYSPDFPTTPGAHDPTHNGQEDAFVMAFNPSRDVIYSTYIGGELNDWSIGLDVDPDGDAYVTGSTWSTGFPTTPATFDATHNDNREAYLSILDAGGRMTYSTFLGGAVDQLDVCCGDRGRAVAFDASGNVTVVGATSSLDFPTTEAGFDLAYGGMSDGFLARLEPIPEPDRDPVAHFDILPSAEAERRVMLDASRSADAEDEIWFLEVRWDWKDDGLWDTEWSTGKEVVRDHDAWGTYAVRLEVRDRTGHTASVVRTVHLAPPEASPLSAHAFALPPQGKAPLAVSFNASALGGRPPYTFEWNFGDGTRGTSAETFHTYDGPGVYTVVLTVTDADGRTTERTLRIEALGADISVRGVDASLWMILLVPPSIGVGVIAFVLRRRRAS